MKSVLVKANELVKDQEGQRISLATNIKKQIEESIEALNVLGLNDLEIASEVKTITKEVVIEVPVVDTTKVNELENILAQMKEQLSISLDRQVQLETENTKLKKELASMKTDTIKKEETKETIAASISDDSIVKLAVGKELGLSIFETKDSYLLAKQGVHEKTFIPKGLNEYSVDAERETIALLKANIKGFDKSENFVSPVTVRNNNGYFARVSATCLTSYSADDVFSGYVKGGESIYLFSYNPDKYKDAKVTNFS